MVKKILVSGYYGMDNAGDELILYCIINDVKKYFPQAALIVLSGAPHKTSKEYSIRAVHRKNPLLILKELILCDVLITGGGGIFQDITGNLSLYYYVLLCLVARVLGKKIMLFAVEIAPLKNKFNRTVVRWVFNHADCVSVRNQESLMLLEKNGNRCLHRAVIPDPVINISSYGAALPDTGDTSKAIGIVVRNLLLDNTRKKQIERIIAAIATRCAAKGFEVHIIPFHRKQDISVSHEIIQHAAAFLVLWNSISELCEIFNRLSLVISSRLHGLVLAYAYAKPFIGVAPADNVDGGKVKRFMGWAHTGRMFHELMLDEERCMQAIEELLNSNTIASTHAMQEKLRVHQAEYNTYWEEISRILK